MYRKRIIATLLLTLFTVGILYAAEGFYTLDRYGNIVQPASCTDQRPWESAGTFLAAGAEPTTPDATNRTTTLFAAVSKVQIYTIPPYWNVVQLREGSTTNNEVNVYDVFLKRGATDHWFRIGTFTYTTGQQTSGTSGSEFADTLVVSNEKWLSPINVLSPTGDYIAIAEIDVRGCTAIGFVPTTLANNAFVEITGF